MKREDLLIQLRDPVDRDAQVHFSYPPVAEIVRMYGGDATDLPLPNLERSQKWLSWFRNHPFAQIIVCDGCLLYTSPSPRDATLSRMPSSA